MFLSMTELEIILKKQTEVNNKLTTIIEALNTRVRYLELQNKKIMQVLKEQDEINFVNRMKSRLENKIKRDK